MLRRHGGKKNVLIMHNGGAVASHGLLLDHADELEGAAERSVQVGPFRALKMSHLQNVVVLTHARTYTHSKSWPSSLGGNRERNLLLRD